MLKYFLFLFFFLIVSEGVFAKTAICPQNYPKTRYPLSSVELYGVSPDDAKYGMDIYANDLAPGKISSMNKRQYYGWKLNNSLKNLYLVKCSYAGLQETLTFRIPPFEQYCAFTNNPDKPFVFFCE